jgi:EmrB/QacA subfamily drug resistance transporter
VTKESAAEHSETLGSKGRTQAANQEIAAVVPLVLVCGAQFVLQLDFSIVNVALPTIQRELSMPAAQLQWIVTGYAMTFGSLLLLGGRLADQVGRRRLLVAGLALFALASLACGLSQWPFMLIASRVVQGAAGAMVSPAALSLLTTMNPEGPARSRALAIWQATTAAGATAGIVVGGLLTEYLGWRAIFLVNPPIAVLILALVRRLPAGSPADAGRVDGHGALLVTASIASLIFGLTNGQQHGFASAVSIVALAAALVLGLAFVLSERTAATPMVPKGIFAAATRRAAAGAMLLIGAVLAGYVYFVSLYLQRVLELSPVMTGVALVPSTLTVVVVSTLVTRRLLGRLSVKTVLLMALTSMAAGQIWFAHISASANYATIVLPGLLLTAVGIGLGLPTASIAITTGVEGRDQGLAGSLFTTSQQTGAAVGLAVLATAAAARTAHAGGSLVAGYQIAFVIAAGMAILAGVLVVVQLSSHACQGELQRQRGRDDGVPPATPVEAALRKV